MRPLLPAITLIGFGFGFVAGALGGGPALGEEHAVLVAEVHHLRAVVGEGIWPGFGEVEAPILLLDGERAWAIDFPGELPGFEACDGPAWFGRPVRVGARPREGLLAAAMDFEGVGSVLIDTPEALGWDPATWVLKTLHEMYHVLEMERGSGEKIASLGIGPRDDASWQLEFPFPYDDTDVMRLVHLVGYPLYMAGVESEDEDAARYNAGMAVEALGVLERLLRETTGDGRAFDYLRFQVWSEGIAKHTEREAVRGAASGEYEPTARFVELAGADAYERAWASYEGQKFLVKHAGRAARSRTAFYHLGLGVGLTLDRLTPGWKCSHFAPDVWPDGLLRGAAGTGVLVEGVKAGAAAPAFEAPTLEGEVVRLEDLRGRVVVVDFWQVWCPPCLQLAPHLERLDEALGEDVVVLGVVAGVDGEAEARLRGHVARHGPRYPTLLDRSGAIARGFAIGGYPHLFVLDREGRIAWAHRGFAPGAEEEIERRVRAAMGE